MTPLAKREMRTLADRVSAEIRAELGRRHASQAALARALDVPAMWVSDRLRGATELTVNDLGRIAEVLGVEIADLLPKGRPQVTVTYPGIDGGRPPNAPGSRRPEAHRPPPGPGRTSRVAPRAR